MMDDCNFVLVYFNEKVKKASGTMIAYKYAKGKKKILINVYFS